MTLTPDPLPPIRPRDVPALRDEMIAFLGEIRSATGLFAWEHLTLTPGIRLIHVSAEMVEMLVEVAATAPLSTTHDALPARPREAFVALGRPLRGTDAIAATSVDVCAVLWGPIRVSDRPAHAAREGISIASFSRDGYGPDGRLWPCGRSEWMSDEALGELLDRPPAPNAPDLAVTYTASCVEDRSLLAALWGLMAEERHVDVSRWEPHNKSQRRRFGGACCSGRCCVAPHCTARPAAVDTDTDTDTPTDTPTPSHRSWIAPYFRMQPYGPNNSLRRLQLVDGYVRGPEGAPFVRRERVWSVSK